MRILVWNIRGIGGGYKNSAFQKLVKEKRPNFFGMIETKHSTINKKWIKGWWEGIDVEWSHVTIAEGSEGLLCSWKGKLLMELKFLRVVDGFV